MTQDASCLYATVTFSVDQSSTGAVRAFQEARLAAVKEVWAKLLQSGARINLVCCTPTVFTLVGRRDAISAMFLELDTAKVFSPLVLEVTSGEFLWESLGFVSSLREATGIIVAVFRDK